MKKIKYAALAMRLVITVSTLSVLPLFTGLQEVNSVTSDSIPFTPQAGVNWQSFSPYDENFSFLVPISPTLFEQSYRGYVFRSGGEKVISKRSYSGYVSDFIFAVDSYQVNHPAKLLEDLLGYYYPDQLKGFENTKLNGFNAKKHQLTNNDIYHDVYYFITKKHLYILTVAAKDRGNPFIAHLLSSFKLDENKSLSGMNNISNQNMQIPSGNVDQIYTIKEVTRKPYVIWKPEPAYTNRARQNQEMGRVTLNTILDSSGQVRILKVVKELGDGLTEQAIEAARNLRFLPAEKDGKNVSVQIRMEYNFNLY